MDEIKITNFHSPRSISQITPASESIVDLPKPLDKALKTFLGFLLAEALPYEANAEQQNPQF
jgi:hypothetical protein